MSLVAAPWDGMLFGPPLDLPMRLRLPAGRFGASRSGGRRSHEGVDLLEAAGKPVYAALRGRVILIRDNTVGLQPGDMYVAIDHHPVANGLITRYLHLQNIAVAIDQEVDYGALLGEVGPNQVEHLHFEVRRVINPDPAIYAGGKERAKNRLQLTSSVPIDATRLMYDWEARHVGFEDTQGPRPVDEFAVIHKSSIAMVQVSWNGAYYHLPLYAPTSAELETVRDAYRDGRSVRLAARDSVLSRIAGLSRRCGLDSESPPALIEISSVDAGFDLRAGSPGSTVGSPRRPTPRVLGGQAGEPT
jgi:hypothetical protein